MSDFQQFSRATQSPKWFLDIYQKNPTFAKKLGLLLASGTITAQSVAAALPLFACGSIKLIDDKLKLKTKLGKKADNTIIDIADNWISINNRLIDALLPDKDWKINLPNDLSADKKYLLVCNHQSWVDTSIIQYISENRLPLTRFFAKHELLYLPIVGQAFYFLDFPMMKRHSKEKIAKDPKLASRDLDEAKRACQLLAQKPFVLLNYLEGTRFNPQKQKKQQSPYRHLLKPKAGGLALAISSLGDDIDGILDMTIVYPDGIPTYQDLWCGNIKRLAVDIKKINIEPNLLTALKNGNYHQKDTSSDLKNQNTKEQFHQWLDELWQQKDKRIDELLAQFSKTAQ